MVRAAASTASDLIGLTIFSSIVAGTASLGVWQIQRYKWKVDLIENATSQLSLPPLETSDSQLPAVNYRPIVLTGRFIPNTRCILSPRSPPANILPDHPSTPSSGGFLYHLFESSSNNKKFIVNTGWLPKDLLPTEQDLGDNTRLTTITVVAATPETRGRFSVDNDTKHKRFFWLDHASMTNAMMMSDCSGGDSSTDGKSPLPQIVEQIELNDEPVDKSKNDLYTTPLKKRKHNYTTFHVMPSQHLIYAATWISLSIFGAILTHKRFKGINNFKKK